MRSAADVVVEGTDEGNDTVRAAVGYTLGAGAQIEHLATLDATATTAIDLTGNAYSHDIQGNAGANVLTGGSGDDLLYGFGGNDTLIGGGGSDRFVFGHGTGSDVVGDFVSGSDKLDLSAFGFAGFGDVQTATHDVGGNAVIDLGNGDMITLTGIASNQLPGRRRNPERSRRRGVRVGERHRIPWLDRQPSGRPCDARCRDRPFPRHHRPDLASVVRLRPVISRRRVAVSKTGNPAALSDSKRTVRLG